MRDDINRPNPFTEPVVSIADNLHFFVDQVEDGMELLRRIAEAIEAIRDNS